MPRAWLLGPSRLHGGRVAWSRCAHALDMPSARPPAANQAVLRRARHPGLCKGHGLEPPSCMILWMGEWLGAAVPTRWRCRVPAHLLRIRQSCGDHVRHRVCQSIICAGGMAWSLPLASVSGWESGLEPLLRTHVLEMTSES